MNTNTVKIGAKIIGYAVKTDEVVVPQVVAIQPVVSTVVQMHEQIGRPDVLDGRTYKIKTPLTPHALYVTINNIVLNEGTTDEVRRPYEIFLASKDTSFQQWTTTLSRMMSAVFRKGGDVTFIVDELKSVHDPNGGYLAPGGRYVPSLSAEIGHVIEQHLRGIGLLRMPELAAEAKAMIEEKKVKITPDAMRNAKVCSSCHAKAVIVLDGCETCLECAASKCG